MNLATCPVWYFQIQQLGHGCLVTTSHILRTCDCAQLDALTQQLEFSRMSVQDYATHSKICILCTMLSHARVDLLVHWHTCLPILIIRYLKTCGCDLYKNHIGFFAGFISSTIGLHKSAGATDKLQIIFRASIILIWTLSIKLIEDWQPKYLKFAQTSRPVDQGINKNTCIKHIVKRFCKKMR